MTDRVWTMRLARPDDADAIAAIYRPIVEATVISFETVAPDADEMARRIAATLVTHPWIAYEMGGAITGYAYGTPHRARAAYRWATDVSVYVDARHRRRGVGQTLYEALFEILAAQGFVNAYAGITLPNPASVGVHEAVGFTPVGVYRKVGFKHGAWHDVGWWARDLRPHDQRPDDPAPLAAVMSRVEAMLASRTASLGDPTDVAG